MVEFEVSDSELTSLKWEAKSRLLDLREREQKYWTRWAALGIGCAVLLLMVFILLYHLFCEPLLPKNSEFLWIIIVAPITSITVITVALFVAAFRRFEDKDSDKMHSGVSLGTNVLGQGDV